MPPLKKFRPTKQSTWNSSARSRWFFVPCFLLTISCSENRERPRAIEQDRVDTTVVYSSGGGRGSLAEKRSGRVLLPRGFPVQESAVETDDRSGDGVRVEIYSGPHATLFAPLEADLAQRPWKGMARYLVAPEERDSSDKNIWFGMHKDLRRAADQQCVGKYLPPRTGLLQLVSDTAAMARTRLLFSLSERERQRVEESCPEGSPSGQWFDEVVSNRMRASVLMPRDSTPIDLPALRVLNEDGTVSVWSLRGRIQWPVSRP